MRADGIRPRAYQGCLPDVKVLCFRSLMKTRIVAAVQPAPRLLLNDATCRVSSQHPATYRGSGAFPLYAVALSEGWSPT